MKLRAWAGDWLIDIPRRKRAADEDTEPWDRRGWLAAGFLLIVTLAYIVTWVIWHRGMLFDPLMQNDDAGTALFMFHRYADARLLAGDTIADAMLYMDPPAVRLLYRLLVPMMGLAWAAKAVTWLALAALAAAGVYLARAARGGWEGGCLLVVLMLQSPYVTASIAGGMPRAFGFPALALWIAGAVTRDSRPRIAGAALAAATYPPVMAMILAGEMLWTAARWYMTRVLLPHAVKHIGLVAGICLLILLPHLIVTSNYGRAMRPGDSVAAALLGPEGRVQELPFPDPTTQFLSGFVDVYREPEIKRESTINNLWPWLIVTALIVAQMMNYARRFSSLASFALGCVILYWAARLGAFSLYSPSRFAINGMQAASIMLAAATFAALPVERETRFSVTGCFLIGLWIFTGGNLQRDRGMTIHYGDNAPLYDFIKTLPADSRIAVHPMDGTAVTFWTGRATTDHYETLQPWRYEPWMRFEQRTHATLAALYATRDWTLREYCKARRVTHILYNLQRYGPNFKTAARSFEPLTSYTDRMLSDVELEQLTVFRIPAQAVAYRDEQMVVVDASKLR